MNVPITGTLVTEDDDGKSVLMVVNGNDAGDWVDLVPSLLREHLLPKIPADGKQYVARISWTIREA